MRVERIEAIPAPTGYTLIASMYDVDSRYRPGADFDERLEIILSSTDPAAQSLGPLNLVPRGDGRFTTALSAPPGGWNVSIDFAGQLQGQHNACPSLVINPDLDVDLPPHPAGMIGALGHQDTDRTTKPIILTALMLTSVGAGAGLHLRRHRFA